MQVRHRAPNIFQGLVGDLNINAYNQPAMEEALQILKFEHFDLSGSIKYSHGFDSRCFNPMDLITKNHNTWLDHFWLTHNPMSDYKSDVKFRVSQFIVPFLGKIRNKSCPLSDHFALHTSFATLEN